MKVKVLRDAKGKILATVDPAQNPLVLVKPVIEDGETFEPEIAAPEEYELNLEDFYKKLEKLKR
jgi:hypothetical protein